MHQRRETSELGPAQQQLGRAALDQPVTEVAADVVRPVGEADTFGQVVLEAQASGLPVVAVGEGGPAALIEHGETGLLAPPRAEAIADALISIVSDGTYRERLVRAALTAVRGRTWEASLDRLAAGYRLALEQRTPGRARSVA